MKDTIQKTHRLSIAALLFVAIIIIGFITLRKPDFEFKVSIDQALEQVLSFEDELSPEEAEDLISNKTVAFQFVDLRNPYEFAKGHIENAINISGKNLLADESIAFFDQMKSDEVVVVVYGYDQSEANGSWMLLKQLGYSNVKILLGGYGYFSGETYDMFSESEIPQYLVEEPKLNFAEIMENLSDGTGAARKAEPKVEMVIPVRKRKNSKVEGGC